VLEAALWGLIAGSSLLAGALVSLAAPIPQRAIGLVMAFGAGALISAVAFELTEEAYAQGGASAVSLGLAAGALTFYVANAELSRRGARHRKRSRGQQAAGTPRAIVLGAVLDGVPESVAIGSMLLGGAPVNAALVAAVALSNVPEALAASTGLRRAGRSRAHVLGLWALVVAVSGLGSALGYGLFGGASGALLGGLQAFAAGSILVMLADTMMPEAFEGGGAAAGLLTTLGFATAFLGL